MSGAERDRLAASVRQRLLNTSRDAGEAFHLVLVRYASERLLYRLSRSRHADEFVLKGAMLLAAWVGRPHRPTRDVDLLGFGEPSPERLARVFGDVVAERVEPDGIVFDPSSLVAEPIRADAIYAGVRVRVLAWLGKTRIPVQVDIGFGDVVTPGPRELVLGPMLGFPGPRLRAYPPETVVAEKFHAIAVLGMVNSRMKDYYDLWLMSRVLGFDSVELRSALASTFERRATPLPLVVPVGLDGAFADDPAKRTQWAAFTRKIGDDATTPGLGPVVFAVRGFFEPILARSERMSWAPGGPWALARDQGSDRHPA